MLKQEGSQFRIWDEASLQRLAAELDLARALASRFQDRIKQRWNPPDLEARTALLRLI